MPVNVELLQKVRHQITEEPRRLDMNYWGCDVAKLSDYDMPDAIPPCGTIACLAGWIVFEARPELIQAIKNEPKSSIGRSLNSYLWHKEHKDIEAMAADLVGIPLRELPFYETDWGSIEVLAWIDRQIDAASK